MEQANQIESVLNNFMTRNNEMKIKEWEFGIATGTAMEAGIKDKKIGGAYEPPSIKDSLEGTAYIRWADGLVSSRVINALFLGNIKQGIEEARKTAYKDKHAPAILKPSVFPDVKVYDPNVAKLLSEDSSGLFMILQTYIEGFKDKNLENLEANVFAKLGRSELRNSKGLEVGYDSTIISTYLSLNNKFSDGYAKRRMPSNRDIRKIIMESEKWMDLSNSEKKVKSGKLPVIFGPDVFGSLLSNFLISHLDGEEIADGNSIFSAKQFKYKERVFDERINLVVDGLKDYELSTFPCTGEGVPAGKEYLIADGRLINPYNDLRSARRMRSSPTCAGGVEPLINNKSRYDSLVRNMDYGLIVNEVLGMHTQTSKTGDYSLPLNTGFLVEKGEITGIVRNAVLAGNFIDALKNPKSKFADYRKDEPVMKTHAYVTAD